MIGKTKTSNYTYEGDELDVFSVAKNWKEYFSNSLRPFIGGSVAEIGAGLGTTTAILAQIPHTNWLAIEPDRNLLKSVERKVNDGALPSTILLRHGSISDLAVSEMFDTILYIDVLEHIKDDRRQIALAASHLSNNGRIIVLSPAYNALFTEFDTNIGHYRRYTLTSLKRLRPTGLNFEDGFYLDSVGVLTSLANKAFLKQSCPTIKQIRFWDNIIVPTSRIIDPLIRRRVGRSVVAVWIKC